MSTTIPRDELLGALREFAAGNGGTPTRTEMNDDGPYSSTPYEREFGGWTAALRAAGLEPNHENDIGEERLFAELHRLAEELGRTPRFEDMAEHGQFSPKTYLRRWGSWPEAKEAAGLDPRTRTTDRIDRGKLIDAIQELADDVGHAPTQAEVIEEGRYSHRPYYRVWDSWSEMLAAAGLDGERERGTPESDLIDALESFADEVGHTPTVQEMNEDGPYSVWPYLRAFDSWNDALRAADLPINKEYGVVTGHVDYIGNWPEQREKALRRDEWRCQECGLTMKAHRCIWKEGLHVHHRTKFREFEDAEAANRLENLVTLCRRCHYERERR